ncbi:MAG TPA: glycine--tRNA ligase subunit beta [Allosphingosinicella sp.]
MPDFLLELLSEEIPARMQAKAREDLARLFAEQIGAAGLYSQGLETYATPRRLVLIARGLPSETAAAREEIKGPRTSAPPQALEGFLRKTGLVRDQLAEREGVWFAVLEKPGRPTASVLAEAVPAIVRAFPWPKSMRWGSGDSRWIRPLQGIIALLGEDIVDFEAAGVASGAATVGHRFHHPGIITIGGAVDYAEKLRACHVVIDPEERVALIRERAHALAAAAGLALVEDEGLLQENAGLTEWPVPLLGSFDPAFLDVPREVIQLTMRANQKYFALTDGEGTLAPSFICVANIEAADGGQAIVGGNQRVLSARLSDARFFWENDLKVPLEEQAGKLSQIVFHEKLGTVADKVDRVAKLARWLVEEGIVGKTLSPEREQLAQMAETAARLCKADLVTGMVGEFPELQGVIGGHLARAQGHPPEVADAIRDHYKPVGQGDAVPTAPVTVAVSLADKLDTVGRFFSIEEYPTGSKDPFALRRAALGIIALIVNNGLRLSYADAAFFGAGRGADVDQDEGAHHRAYATLESFFADRLKVQQREAGVRHDLIDAVFALGGEDDLVRLLARVKALQAFVETPEGADLLAGYKRAANILKRENWGQQESNEAAESVGPNKTLPYTPLPEEAALIAALDAAEPRARAAVEAEDFEGAMAALASLRAPVDSFFDKVTVNDPDPARREARLNLLMRIRDAVHRVADFSRIEG